jgi:hypothetical protein
MSRPCWGRLLGPMENEQSAPAAAIIPRGTPHTRFQDPGFPRGRTRESIEFRTVAYFE